MNSIAIDRFVSNIDTVHSLSSVLVTALEEYVNNPKKTDINSILDTVRVIDNKLDKATAEFVDKTVTQN